VPTEKELRLWAEAHLEWIDWIYRNAIGRTISENRYIVQKVVTEFLQKRQG